jgi:hypothetical protein
MHLREPLIKAFLENIGWAAAQRDTLVADASGRTYERLNLKSQNAILMNAPYEADEDVRPFISVGNLLADFGLSPPKILNQDIKNGFLLLEDFGNDIFADLCKSSPELEITMYDTAVSVLVNLHQNSAPDNLLPYTQDVYLREAKLLIKWYMPAVIGKPVSDKISQEFDNITAETFSKISTGNQVLVMRDYHAENLMWLPNRIGIKKVGLLDFQDALAGHAAYDLVSLLEDARRDTSSELRKEMLKKYLSKSNRNPENFITAYSLLGAQRNIKIIGIFARLALRDKKAHYVDLIPRVWEHLMRDLQHPACYKLMKWITANVPPPTLEVRKKLLNIS